MPNVETENHGAAYVFGFAAADAPNISNFTGRKAQSDVEPEVFATATDGEGHVEAVAVSLPAKRMINLSVTGYISSSFDAKTVANTFSFLTRFFIIKKISDPRNKGEYVEVTIDAVSYANVTS